MISSIVKEHLDKALRHIQQPVKVTRILTMTGKVERRHKSWIVNETPKFYMQVSGCTRLDVPGGGIVLNESDVAILAPAILHQNVMIPSVPESLHMIVNFRNGRTQLIASGRREMAQQTGINDRDHLNPAFRPAMLETMNLLINPHCELSEESRHVALKSFLYMTRDAYDRTNRYESEFPHLIEQALVKIKDQISDSSLNVITLAEELNCSPEHLSRLFSKSYGTPLKRFLMEQRLELAESILLTQQQMRISEVAYMSGFSSPGYFCATFKKNKGMTAEEYRSKYG